MKSNSVKVIRYFIIISICVFLFVISVYFVTHLRERSIDTNSRKEIEKDEIDEKYQPEHREFERERKMIEISANKHYRRSDEEIEKEDEKEIYFLEGNVKVVDFGESEDEDVFVYADKGVHNKKQTYFKLSGGVKLIQKDLEIRSIEIDYHRKNKSFKTTEGVEFSSQRLDGSSEILEYSLRQKKLLLEKNVKLEIKPGLDSDFPVSVSVDRLEYNRRKRRGRAAGSVHIDYGERFASSKRMNFKLFPNEQNIKTLSLIGAAKAFYAKEKEDSNEKNKNSTVFYSGDIRELKADRIDFQAFWDSREIKTIESRGKSMLKIYSDEDSFAFIKAQDIKIAFNKKGEIIRFDAVKDAEIQNKSIHKEENWIVKGHRIKRKGRGDYFCVTGEEGNEPEMNMSGKRILAEEIFLYLENNNIVARNNVKIILSPENKADKSVGFFSTEKPVFITAKIMRYFNQRNHFILTGNVKAWQEKEMVQAEKLDFFLGTGALSGNREVKSVFPYKGKENEKEKRLEILSDEVRYKPEKHLLLFKKKNNECLLNIEEAVIRADSFTVYLKKESGDIKEIVAKRNVIITWNQYVGRGNTAFCYLDEEKIELIGNPVLEEKDKGKTEGYKLTFFIADDKIAIENRQRERSITEIKS
ncbi:MAG: LptA/OstA family protein [Candidatus Aminicenantaceae bacterium]